MCSFLGPCAHLINTIFVTIQEIRILLLHFWEYIFYFTTTIRLSAWNLQMTLMRYRRLECVDFHLFSALNILHIMNLVSLRFDFRLNIQGLQNGRCFSWTFFSSLIQLNLYEKEFYARQLFDFSCLIIVLVTWNKL